MSDTSQGPSHKAPGEPSGLGLSRLGLSRLEPAKGPGRQAIMATSGNSTSPFPYGDGAPNGLIGGLTQREANTEAFALGDILVDLDACPGGTGLAVWIVGG